MPKAAMCRDCPFRVEGHIHVSTEDVETMVDFSRSHRMVCHSDQQEERECAGAIAFHARVGGEAFKHKSTMLASHRRSKLPLWKTWGME